MKKQILAGLSILALSASLVGCGLSNVGTTGRSVVGTGVGFVSSTGKVVGSTVTTGVAKVGTLIGYPATRQDVITYHRKGVVYHQGHAYRIENGRYVLVR